MDATALIASLRSARSVWVDLPGGVAVRVRRPVEADFGKFVAGISVDHACTYVDAWRNVTEATIQGDAVGADDPVEFSAELWREWVTDRVDCLQIVQAALADSISNHLKSRKDATGN